ncbi:2-polyprenyl-6-methoxyphenol hydroxylase [hydrothermal vent metagenome]|uniref:2-polyprenyl-6-methoxyphenol hydroxylase n=1 Tax=hydrothermal vent metagenome TaxID=652676 RepID=A0A3B0YH93_9ZZZZ
MQTEYDLVIIGAGLVGASLACALADTPLKIAIVEQFEMSDHNHASYDDRSVALSYGSRLLFETFGFWDSIESLAEPIKQIHVSEKNRFGSTRLNCESESVKALGYVIENRSLGNLLLKRIESAANITMFCPAELQSIDNESIAVDSITGSACYSKILISYQAKKIELRAKLLIAADGVQSRVRELLDIKVSQHKYHQSAIICNVTPELAHNGVAWERFTDTGPLAFLPLPDFSRDNISKNNFAVETPVASSLTSSLQHSPRCSVVWTVLSEQVKEIMVLDDESFLKRLQSRFGYSLGHLEKTGKRSVYPLSLLQAEKTVLANTVLIGNALHTLHPVAGQGFNLGLRDVGLLAELLLDAVDAGQNIANQELLACYTETREEDYRRVIRFTDNLVRWFSFNLRPAQITRSIGLVLIDRVPWLKSAIARRAMGLGSSSSSRRSRP